MKKILYTFIALLLSASISAQAPESFKYQAVARDASDNVIANQTVGMQVSILQGSISGTSVYIETFTPTTNQFGLINLEIGKGTVVSGAFSGIGWGSDSYFIKIEMDASGGTTYTEMGTSQLLSVPYALHAKTVKSITEADPVFGTSVASGITGADTSNWNSKLDSYTETDPVFGASVASGINETDTAYWNNKLDTEIDSSITNEIQALSISNDTIFLSNGGFVKLPIGPPEAEENDLITFDGTNWVARSALIQNNGGSQAQNNMQPWIGIYHIIALQGIYPSRNSAEPFIAEITMFGGNFAPRGWAFCDGQLLPIAQYTALFSFLGTTFGGDGRTTFGLPDLRGRTAIHPGNSPGLSSRRWGEKGGAETNIMNIVQMPAHNHTITYQ